MMNNTNTIIESFRRLALERGGLLFFTAKNAILVIEALEQARIRVLGLDAFRVTESETQPLMEESVDLSTASNNTWEDAKHFLNKRSSSGLFFEIVADD